jgi:hypothetical protein
MTFQIRQHVLHSGFYADRCGSSHVGYYRFLYVIILSGSLTQVTRTLCREEILLVRLDIAPCPTTVASDVVLIGYTSGGIISDRLDKNKIREWELQVFP